MADSELPKMKVGNMIVGTGFDQRPNSFGGRRIYLAIEQHRRRTADRSQDPEDRSCADDASD